MIDLDFRVDSVGVLEDSAEPTLRFGLEVVQPKSPIPIRNILLRCQFRIEPTKRTYSPEEREALSDLYGTPSEWGRTLKALHWTHVNWTVPAFSESIRVELPVPCSFDFNASATKYFAGLDDGEIPVSIHFSGTAFVQSEAGLQALPIPWDREASSRVPVAVWRAMRDRHYPNAAWLCLGRATFERLERFKREHGLPTWEGAFDRLLERAEQEVSP